MKSFKSRLNLKQFTPCSCLPFKQLNHTCATCRGGIKKSPESAFLLFFFLISPVLHPSPEIGLTSFSRSCRAHATSTVHSSHCFSPDASLLDHYTWIPLSLHGLEANDTSERNTVGTVAQYRTACFPTERQTEARR